MPDEETRGGGPKTPDGKERSSQNSTDHGLRSTKFRILADESQEDFDDVERGWWTQFAPEDYEEDKLVRTLVLNDWLHQRAERRLLQVEATIAEVSGIDPTQWTADQRHQIELIQRYKTTAERAFYRALAALQGLRRDFRRLQREVARLEAENRRLGGKLTSVEQKLEGKESEERDPEQPRGNVSRGVALIYRSGPVLDLKGRETATYDLPFDRAARKGGT